MSESPSIPFAFEPAFSAFSRHGRAAVGPCRSERQNRSPGREKGHLLATLNFLNLFALGAGKILHAAPAPRNKSAFPHALVAARRTPT